MTPGQPALAQNLQRQIKYIFDETDRRGWGEGRKGWVPRGGRGV